MADSWEDEADDITIGGALPALSLAQNTDRWEGEDADEVPDAWDAEPAVTAKAEKKPPPPPPPQSQATTKAKKGKLLAEAAERKKREEAEERSRLGDAPSGGGESAVSAAFAKNLSAEELRRIQEESDLLIAKDTFGVSDAPAATVVPAVAVVPAADPQKSIDLFQATTKEDFERLGKLLSHKLRGFEASPLYAGFVEALYRDCALELDPECLRRLSVMFTALAAEKQKIQKATKAKAKPKAAAKGSVKMERSAAGAIGGEDYDDQYDEFDDFM